MKRFLFSVFLLLGAGVSAASAITQPVWQGVFLVNSINSQCIGYPAVGTQYPSIIRQNRVGSGDEPAAFTLIDLIKTMRFFEVSDSSLRFRASGALKEVGVDTHARSYQGTATYTLVTNPAIASWTATSPFLTATLTIIGFEQPGCRVVLKGGFSRVPGP